MMKLKTKIITRYKKDEEWLKSKERVSATPMSTRSTSVTRRDNRKKSREALDVMSRSSRATSTTADSSIHEATTLDENCSQQTNVRQESSLKKDHVKNIELQQLKREIRKISKQNTDTTTLLKISRNQNKQLKAANKVLQKELLLLRNDFEKTQTQEEKNEMVLRKTRALAKQCFKDSVHSNFAQTYSNMITEIQKLYDLHAHSSKTEHCPAIVYMNSIPDPITSRSCIDGSVSNSGPAPKRMKADLTKDIGHKYYSKNALRELVMNLEQRHSECYNLWRNVLWALHEYGYETGYETLSIAMNFSQRSSKYMNQEDVKKTFYSSDGTLSVQYLIKMSNIYEEGLEKMTDYVNTLIPSSLAPLTLTQVDISDRRKFRLRAHSADESHTLFIIPDVYVLTDEDGRMLSFLRRKISSRSLAMAPLCPEMESGFIVFLEPERFVFRSRINSSFTVTLYYPLKAADVFISFPGGKRSDKYHHLSTIQKALRAEAIKLLSKKSGKNFGDVDDDMVILDQDPDTTRSDIELVGALFEADPDTMSRYRSSGKTIYHCNPETNLWCKLTEKSFDWHLQENLRNVEKLTKAELKYIGMRNAITKMRDITLGKIENLKFADSLNSNVQLFVTENKTIVTSCIPPIIRSIEKEDLAETTCGWSYCPNLSEKYKESVQLYFDKLFPQQLEREWFLSFIARMLNGETTDELFLILADERNGKNGKTTLISLLRDVFGNYYLANSKIVVSGGNRDKSQYDGGIYSLKGKRLLVADELPSTGKLNSDFIKAITGQCNYQIKDKMKFSQTQFEFPVQARLVVVSNENEMPLFDKNDKDFIKRMVICPMRSRFVSEEEFSEMERCGENMTGTYVADKSLRNKFTDWRSATLDLLIKYYTESVPTIPSTMEDWKKSFCNKYHDYAGWMDNHVRRSDSDKDFVTATQILGRIKKPKKYYNPNEVRFLKTAMEKWAKENDYTYQGRYVYWGKNRHRVEAKSAILNAVIDIPVEE